MIVLFLLNLWFGPFTCLIPTWLSRPVLFVLRGAFDLAAFDLVAMKKQGTTGTHLLRVMGGRMGFKE